MDRQMPGKACLPAPLGFAGLFSSAERDTDESENAWWNDRLMSQPNSNVFAIKKKRCA